MKKLLQCSLGLITALSLNFAQAEEVSAEKREAIHQLIEVMNLKGIVPQLMAQISAQSSAMMKQGAVSAIEQNKSLTEAQRKDALNELEQELPAVQEDLRQSLAKFDMGGMMEEVMYGVYGKYFEAQEIRDITAFYQSGTGKKMLTLLPQITSESMQITMSRMAPIINEMLEKSTARLDARLKDKSKTKSKKS